MATYLEHNSNPANSARRIGCNNWRSWGGSRVAAEFRHVSFPGNPLNPIGGGGRYG
jgi:hypothetical protein